MKKQLTVALAGNPNAGKTTIFNNLTGARQHVGNYPGVTVEKKEGYVSFGQYDIKVIDLPGTYSLTSFSLEEVVARNVLLDEEIDVVVNVVDATNLERNLYLTAQLKELGQPLVVALNMMDMAKAKGIDYDHVLLSQLLGDRVLPVVGTKNQGINELLDAIIMTAEGKSGLLEKLMRYSDIIENQIQSLEELIPSNLYIDRALSDKRRNVLQRWFAIKLLEKDKDILTLMKGQDSYKEIIQQLESSRQVLEQAGQELEMAMVEGRYAYVRGACRESQRLTLVEHIDITEKIDNILLHRVLGLPIFLGLMWVLFQLTFTLGALPMEWIDAGFKLVGDMISSLMPDGLLKSLLIDGIIGGVGGVMVFLPNILLLFLGIAFLEGTGYMARAAFVMDKLMHKVGLHGKSFIPMIIGFGCTVPALMATRTLENNRDRLVTMLVVPLMSCGARLPVYTLFIAAFFNKNVAGTILFSIYLVGIILAVLMAKVLRTVVLPGDSEPFVMELPAYRLPTFRSIMLQMWEKAWLYMKKAGTIILMVSIIMWTLFTFPQTDTKGQPFETQSQQLSHSYAAKLGHLIEPVIKPLGFDWKTGVALVAGFAAKEVVVSTLGTIYSLEDVEAVANEEETAVAAFAQRAKDQSGYNPLVAYVLMLFVLIYVPCLATLATLRRESNSWKWPTFLAGYTLSLAWIVSFIIYRAGILLGIGI